MLCGSEKGDLHAWDLVASIEKFCQMDICADMFARFLETSYDDTDLMFFLFARSLCVKRLRANLNIFFHDIDGECLLVLVFV